VSLYSCSQVHKRLYIPATCPSPYTENQDFGQARKYSSTFNKLQEKLLPFTFYIIGLLGDKIFILKQPEFLRAKAGAEYKVFIGSKMPIRAYLDSRLFLFKIHARKKKRH